MTDFLSAELPTIAHATGLSQWLMTNFLERRIYSAFWEGEPSGESNLRSGRSLNLQENSPTKVGAQVLRHQLRVKNP